jgi:hypothetical protein
MVLQLQEQVVVEVGLSIQVVQVELEVQVVVEEDHLGQEVHLLM